MAIAIRSSSFGATIRYDGGSLVFENAGTMRIPLEDALQGGRSDPRNRVIFQCFLALGASDYGGFGIPKIFSLMDKMGYWKPLIEEDPIAFSTKLELNFTRFETSLKEDHRRVLDLLLSSKEGLSVREISHLAGFSYEKTRKITEALLAKDLIEENGKDGRGHKLSFRKGTK